MLDRKPFRGELLDYDSSVVGGQSKAEYRVLGFGTRVGQDTIMFVADTVTGAETSLIWKFSDCLNKCLSHKPQTRLGGSTTTPDDCGNCAHAGEHCAVFERRVRCFDAALGREVLRRLPECVAAEQGTSGGAP